MYQPPVELSCGGSLRLSERSRLLGCCSSFRIGGGWKSRRELLRRYMFEGEGKAFRPGCKRNSVR